jgi:predicted small lipoprotein YifL
MRMGKSSFVAVLVVALATLAACGTKSDLVPPGDKATPPHRHRDVVNDHNPSQPPAPIGQ